MDVIKVIVLLLLMGIVLLPVPLYCVVKLVLFVETVGAMFSASESAEFAARTRWLIYIFLILAGIFGAVINIMFYSDEHVTLLSDRLLVILAPLPQLLWFSTSVPALCLSC